MVYSFNSNQTPSQSFVSKAFLNESSHVKQPEPTAPSITSQSSDSSSTSFFSFDLVGNRRHQLSTNPSRERPESFATKRRAFSDLSKEGDRTTLLLPSSATREETVSTTGQLAETSESGDDDMNRERQLKQLAIKMRLAADCGVAFCGRTGELTKSSSSEGGESVSTTERQVGAVGSNETRRANQLQQLAGSMKLAAEQGTAFSYRRNSVSQGSPVG